MPIPVLAVVTQANRGSSNSSCFIAPFRFLTNPCQHSDTGSEFRRWNVGKQFMSKFVRRDFNRRDNPLGASAEVHHVATAIALRALTSHPTFSLQPVHYRYNAGFFHTNPFF